MLTPRNKATALHGFTLIEIMIVVGLIALLAAIAIPSFLRARNNTRKNTCINNLRQIDSAKHQWAQENKRVGNDAPTSDDLKYYIKNNEFPTCPASGAYTVGALDVDPTCSKSADGHKLPSD